MTKKMIKEHIKIAKKYFSVRDIEIREQELKKMMANRRNFGVYNYNKADLIEALSLYASREKITTETIFTILDILGVDYD